MGKLGQLKDRWIAKGYLLPVGDGNKTNKEFQFCLLGKTFVGEFRTASSGSWDDYTSSGTVHTIGLAIRKCRMLTETDDIIEFNQIIVGKWAFSWSIMEGVLDE